MARSLSEAALVHVIRADAGRSTSLTRVDPLPTLRLSAASLVDDELGRLRRASSTASMSTAGSRQRDRLQRTESSSSVSLPTSNNVLEQLMESSFGKSPQRVRKAAENAHVSGFSWQQPRLPLLPSLLQQTGDKEQSLPGASSIADEEQSLPDASSIADLPSTLPQEGDGSIDGASRSKSMEKSWTLKRKEAYLKRYGRRAPDTPPAPDTAVTAVGFVGALKARAAATRAADRSDALELS